MLVPERIRTIARRLRRLRMGKTLRHIIHRRGKMMTELEKELQRIRGREMSPEEIEAQRVSFVYGNAPADDHGTKETVRKSLEMVS